MFYITGMGRFQPVSGCATIHPLDIEIKNKWVSSQAFDNYSRSKTDMDRLLFADDTFGLFHPFNACLMALDKLSYDKHVL